MQAAIRHGDRAIIDVSTPIPPAGPGQPYTWTVLAPRDDAEIVTFTQRQMAHWLSLTIPAGEVMYLDDEDNIGVLTPAPTDPQIDALRSFAAEHNDPRVRELARLAGL